MQKLIAPVLLTVTAFTAAAGTFNTQPLTGDADSGISTNNAYTHAIDMGDGANRTINGAVFTGGGTPGTNNYTIGGIDSQFNNWPVNNPPGTLVTGATGGLFTNFQYQAAGGNESVTLRNLRVGQQYVTTFYNSVWGGPRSQNITASDGGAITFDPDAGATGTGSLLKYTFTATANTMTYNIAANQVASFHQYGFSNQVIGHTALVTDNFYAPSNPNTLDLNFNLAARQGGSLVTSSGVKSWVGINNAQVGNPTGGIDGGNYLLNAFFNGSAALDYNFNGSASQGGLSISFDLAPNIGGAGGDNWEALNLGASSADKNGFVNGGHTHFGILFRGQGTIQAFDGSSVVSGGTEPVWGPGGVTTALNHFELLFTDPGDGNPFDGLGQTNIDVFANGNPVYSFTKGGGGYANNYINFEGSHIGGIDNLVIAQMIPEPGTVTLAGLAALALVRRRRTR